MPLASSSKKQQTVFFPVQIQRSWHGWFKLLFFPCLDWIKNPVSKGPDGISDPATASFGIS
jgi:hypothetical protein